MKAVKFVHWLAGENGQLFGWSQETWLLWDQLGIFLGLLTTLLALAGALTAYLNRERLRRWWRGNRFPRVGQPSDEQRYDGIVFLVSQSDLPPWVLDQTGARLVGLLTGNRFHEVADRLVEQLGNRVELLPTQLVASSEDPADSKLLTRRLIEQLRERGCQRIAVDITGTTKPMSIGAFMAAEELRCDSLYVTCEHEPGKGPRLDSARLVVISSPG